MNENVQASSLGVADIQKLLANLPHRYPFLLIDRIVDIDRDVSATGIKNVSINEPHFAGHFPELPIMPGVLIIEAMAQTAGAIVLFHNGSGKPGKVFFMTIDNAKFRKYSCVAEVDGVKVAEADVAAMVSFPEEDETGA